MSTRRYRYTGKERDDETGLYYNGARYLAAWLGRWTSADPIGIGADGPGLYNYTRGSPVNYTDPSGTDAVGQGIADALDWASNEIDRSNYEAGAQTVDPGPPATRAQEPGNQGFETDMFTSRELAYRARVDAQMAAHDYDAVDERGQNLWEKDSAGGWQFVDRLEFPLGTEDVELQLYTAGVGYVLGRGAGAVLKLSDEVATGFGATGAVDDALGGLRPHELVDDAFRAGNFIEVPAAGPARLPAALDPKQISFMQSSIKNQTGEFTVVGNAERLLTGEMQPTALPPMNVWQDPSGKIWTLDHRRLAAFRMAGTEEAPVVWAPLDQVRAQQWKMSTTTRGASIRLKFPSDGNFIVE